MSLRNYREYDTDERKVADLRFAVLGFIYGFNSIIFTYGFE